MPKPTRSLELRLRPRARRDLAGIWSYTKRRWSSEQANRYLAKLHAEIERLCEQPDLGRPVKKVQAPFLRRTCGSHVIFYLVHPDTLDIVRVLHERMDFVSHLANDEA